MKINKTTSSLKRKDWEINNQKIREAFISVLKRKQGKRPTLAELAKESKLSVIAVRGHMHDLKFEAGSNMFRILTDDVILAMYRTAMKGNPAAQKLWMQVIEGWSEKNELKHSGEVVLENKPPVILRFTKDGSEVEAIPYQKQIEI
jgi:hypothetical protein